MDEINENVIIRNKNLSDSALIPTTKPIASDSDSEEQCSLNNVISSIDLNNSAENHNEMINAGVDDDDNDLIQITTQNQVDIDNQKQQQQKSVAVTRPCQFSISRVKNIMKLDPELSLTSKESVFLVAKATVSSIKTHF
jgi:hypothetical protein